jgi:hypothetical protein
MTIIITTAITIIIISLSLIITITITIITWHRVEKPLCCNVTHQLHLISILLHHAPLSCAMSNHCVPLCAE